MHVGAPTAKNHSAPWPRGAYNSGPAIRIAIDEVGLSTQIKAIEIAILAHARGFELSLF